MSLKTDSLGDLTGMIDIDEFADTVTKADSSTFKAIFDGAYAGISLETGEVASSAPQLTCESSDVASLNKGDTLTVNSVTYKIIEFQDNGTGVTVIMLSRD